MCLAICVNLEIAGEFKSRKCLAELLGVLVLDHLGTETVC